MSIINETNLNIRTMKENLKLSDETVWHKFTIRGTEKLEREVILKSIRSVVRPEELNIRHFSLKNNSASFLACNCNEAILKLCKNRLKVPCKELKNSMQIEIVLDILLLEQLKHDPDNKVLTYLNKKNFGKELNLSQSLSNDTIISVCNSANVQPYDYVLRLASLKFKPHILRFAENGITSIIPIVHFFQDISIESLDLRNNKIASCKDLQSLSTFKLNELWLDGNPLCDHYFSFDYVMQLKSLIPTLEYLDGRLIKVPAFHLEKKQVFLCTRNGQDFASSFILHYFSLYDLNRPKLVELYHEEAMFSMTTILPAKKSNNFNHYQNLSRNIIEFSSFSQSEESLFNGRDQIFNLFSNLPKTKHCKENFTVDLVYYNGSSAVIIVTGQFREIKSEGASFNFSRIFILKKYSSYYLILNELFQIRFVSTTLTSTENDIWDPLEHFDVKYNKSVIQTFEELTNIEYLWSERFLNEFNYNIQKSLAFFTENFDNIPDFAFRKSVKLEKDMAFNETDASISIKKEVEEIEGVIIETREVLEEVQENEFIRIEDCTESEYPESDVSAKYVINLTRPESCKIDQNVACQVKLQTENCFYRWFTIPENQTSLKVFLTVLKSSENFQKLDRPSTSNVFSFYKTLYTTVDGFSRQIIFNPEVVSIHVPSSPFAKSAKDWTPLNFSIKYEEVQTTTRLQRTDNVPLNIGFSVMYTTKSGFSKWYYLEPNQEFIEVPNEIEFDSEMEMINFYRPADVDPHISLNITYITGNNYWKTYVIGAEEASVLIPKPCEGTKIKYVNRKEEMKVISFDEIFIVEDGEDEEYSESDRESGEISDSEANSQVVDPKKLMDLFPERISN